MEKLPIVTVGTILTIESGEYSDSQYHGPFIVTRELDRDDLERQIKEELEPKLAPGDLVGWDNVIVWLHANGYIEDIANKTSWYIGAYHAFDYKSNAYESGFATIPAAHL